MCLRQFILSFFLTDRATFTMNLGEKIMSPRLLIFFIEF